MHATIQKPLKIILDYLKDEEKVFIIGCGNCARKCQSGGEPEVNDMKERLERSGKIVTGKNVPDAACSLGFVNELVETNREAVDEADSLIVLACGQGVHTVIDATGKIVHPGCDTIFGGETLSPGDVREYCSLCGECIVEDTGGLCPLTLCSKQLLNGPCGGAVEGKCEVDTDRDCGWQLIYERLKEIGKLEKLNNYSGPKNYSRWNKPRTLKVTDGVAVFKFETGEYSPESTGEGSKEVGM